MLTLDNKVEKRFSAVNISKPSSSSSSPELIESACSNVFLSGRVLLQSTEINLIELKAAK